MMTKILALDLEGVLISNAVSQFPRPGLMSFLSQCDELFGRDNICIFTTVPEPRFRDVAHRLVVDGYAPEWLKEIRYIQWTGKRKDLRFVDDDINRVIIVDDYSPNISDSQKHRLIPVAEYTGPQASVLPDTALARLLEKLESMHSQGG